MGNLWAVKWRSENKVDGKTEHFVRGKMHIPLVFNTRIEARFFIKEQYGFIASREDLQEEPHGWKMPVAVKVKIEVKEI